MLRAAVGKAAVGGVAVAGRVDRVDLVLELVRREVTVAVEQAEVLPILAVEVEVSVVMALLIQESTGVQVELVLYTLL